MFFSDYGYYDYSTFLWIGKERYNFLPTILNLRKQKKSNDAEQVCEKSCIPVRNDFREPGSRPSTSSSDNRLNNKFQIPIVGERKWDSIVVLTEERKAKGPNNILL